MDSSTGFCPTSTRNGMMNVQTRIPTSTSTSLNLKASEILARARQAAGQPAVEDEEDEEAPQIFTDEILNDMQQSLLALEDRIKGGPGSLSKLEVTVLEARLDRIVDEMYDFMINGNEFAMPVQAQGVPATMAAAPVKTVAAPAATTMSFPVPAPAPAPVPVPVTMPMPAPAMMPEPAQGQIPMTFQSQQVQSMQAPVAVSAPAPAPVPAQTGYPSAASASSLNPQWTQNEEEGPAYEGKGGMGLASGTANTWVIDGMDEMTGEEYRRALQESVSARQRARRTSRAGYLGNLQSNNYLDSL